MERDFDLELVEDAKTLLEANNKIKSLEAILEHRKEEFETANEQRSTQFAVLEEEMKVLRARLASEESRNTDLEDQLKNRQERLRRAQDECKKAKDEAKSSENQSAIDRKAREEIAHERDKLIVNFGTLDTELSVAKDEISSLERKGMFLRQKRYSLLV